MLGNVTIFSLALALLWPGGQRVQDEGGPCPDVYPEPKLGHYADMKFTNAAGESMMIRFAIVGEEVVEGRTHYWLEVVSVPPSVGGTVIAQMLVPYYPFDNEDLQGYVIKMPGRPAAKVPREMLEAIGAGTEAGPGWRAQCAAAEDLGLEEVTVAAGTFTARHYRGGGEKSGEIWIADVPFGMVKFLQADGEMELVKYGADAESLITEEPIEIEVPPPEWP
jgi:hypothetical protein